MELGPFVWVTGLRLADGGLPVGRKGGREGAGGRGLCHRSGVAVLTAHQHAVSLH